jgi:predicted nuclease of predicted toxin-antitoxin system
VKLLLDEMYAGKLAQLLRDQGIDAATVTELGLAARSDADVFTAAADEGYVLLTENVSDFARLCGEHVAAGGHHFGVLIALSSRFSRRPAGYGRIVTAVVAMAADQLDDRLVYLERPSQG